MKMYMPSMELHVVMHCLPLLLVLLAVDAFESNNNVTDSSRALRSSRRVVRLYSGTRPDPLVCLGEGFQADPVNCAVFYRCMKSGRGRFMSFKFQCAPGTIYDPETEVCNHPSKVRRSGCGIEHTVSISDQISGNGEQIPDNAIEEVRQELPSPISTKNPFYTLISSSSTVHPWMSSSKLQEKSTVYPWLTSNINQNKLSTIAAKPSTASTNNHKFSESSFSSTKKQRSTTPRASSVSRQPIVQNGDLCQSEGFMGDSENCRKFYRCISNFRGGYIRYEFMCTESTIWDEDIQSCNHAWAVKRRRCGRGNVNDLTDAQENRNEVVPQDSTTPRFISSSPNQQTNNVLLVSQTLESSSYVTQSQSNTTVMKTTIRTNPTTIFPIDARQTQNYVSSTEKRTTPPENESSDSGYNSINLESNDEPVSNECSQSGFMGDKNNCKKFYRCVDNGRESYTKYEFSCGEGTVWDPNLKACNHAWAVKECGGTGSTQDVASTTTSRPSASTATSTKSSPAYVTSTTTRKPHTTTGDDEDVGYGNQNQNPSTISTSTQSSSFNSTQVTKQPGGSCTSSGFMGDENDCKKFYRCVDNGDGSFTRYEFTCGEGTVWDSNLEACNHAWAVKDCGGKGPTQGTTSGSIVTSTTSTQSTPSYVTSSQTTSVEGENVGYGNQGQDTSSTSSSTYSTSSSIATEMSKQPGNSCTASGFMGDESDCKIFYRCVDNGDGTYSRYEFSCGEGTVWDSNVEACNHPWAVPKCGGSSSGTTENYKPPTTMTETTTYTAQTAQTQNDDADSGYGIHHDENPSPLPSTTTTSKQPQVSGNNCTSTGFMGDQYDCKKFYRCVDNGNGGFTLYEFTCGEGTVWDPEIEACNHAWAVKKCGGTLTNELNKEEGTTSEGTTVSSSSVTSTSDDNEIDTGYGQSSSQSTVVSSSVTSQQENDLQTSVNCKSDGFMGDKNVCKKFYRCVDNGNGGYIKYEFTCGDGTVWNQEIQACDHDNGHSCSYSGDTSVSKQPANDEMYPDNNTTKEPSSSESSATENTSQTQTPSQSSTICRSEGFYADSNDCKNFYRCVDNGQGSFTKYEFTCGDGTVWDQEIQACDHESNGKCRANTAGNETDTKPTSSPVSTSTTAYTDEYSTTSSTTEMDKNQSSPAVSTTNDTCSSEGFYHNSIDCRKFYRCVDNGKGGYTKYDFTCGEGTMWVQEIQACDHQDDDSKCTKAGVMQTQTEGQESTTGQQQSSTLSSSVTSTIRPQTTENPNDEYQDSQSNAQGDNSCSSEGFHPNKHDCRKFYRCVDNGQGSYTKYDFSCGEGTAWDTDIQTCNHISEVSRCRNGSHEDVQNKPMQDEGSSQTTEGSSSTEKTTPSSPGSSEPSSKDTCESEGYFGNTKDCTKFYRCVDNGNGGYTKYDFDCGEGTIWDQDVQTCNHPQDVVNPSCSQSNQQTETSSSSTSTTESSGSNTESTSQSTSNCSQENTTKKPANQNVTCEKAGYYPNPNDCKKFYRCVDWDGNGERFSVYHFECGEGTIWDPQLDTCNHEESVYPPRDCSGVQSQTEHIQETTTTEGSTTSQQPTESTTSEQTTSQETTTQQSPTTESTTTQQSTTESTTTQQSTTKSTTTQQTTESSTTQQSTTESTTTQQTTEGTTTQQQTTESTSTEGTTTQQSTTETTTTQQLTTERTTTEGTTTQQSTTESTTTDQTNESTTTQQSTTDTTMTQQSTTESTTTPQTEETTSQESTTTESTTTQQTTTSEGTTSTTDANSTEQLSTSQTDSSGTTESTNTEESTDNQSTTESMSTTESSSNSKECPDTEDDQYLYVCPTSFRRHPKYCNMFYQCTEDDDSHEPKIAVFSCPNNTIYDESKIQCVEESKADKKCDGQIAQRRRIKRLNAYYKEPIVVGRDKYSCSSTGYYPFEKTSECSPAFLKCQKAKSGQLRGYVHLCPEGYLYWSISKRCERKESLKDCKISANDWSRRWEIPVERKNVAL